jgi:hypothetical protein
LGGTRLIIATFGVDVSDQHADQDQPQDYNAAPKKIKEMFSVFQDHNIL